MNAERVSSLFWLVIGVAASYGGYDLGLGSAGEPGSGFLTFVAGMFVTLMALIIHIKSYRDKPEDQVRLVVLWQGVKWQRTIRIILLIIAFILVFEKIGFLICSFALLVIIMRWLEGLNWKTSLLIPSITVLVTYVLFTIILKTSLPSGVFGF